MSQPLRFGHPLYGAELRLARARQLIGTMHRQYQRYADAHQRSGWIGTIDATTRQMTLKPRLPDERHVHVPRISVTFGEIAYNVRSALDYLVYSIARANNKAVEVPGTQFPLEDSSGRYWSRWTGKDPKTGKRVARMLNKIPHEIAKDLSHYQPYARCVWAELLRDISNPDKHRHLTTLGVSAEFVSDRPILRVIDTESNRHTIPMRGKIKVSVTFNFRDDPIDIIEASQLVQREATALIRSYAGRFKIPPPGLIEDELPGQRRSRP